MRYLALIVVLAGCSCRVQSAPALPADPPAPPAAPEPARPACEFPPEPTPPSIVGYPENQELLTTRSDALELRRYLLAGAEWRRAVEKCLGGAQ